MQPPVYLDYMATTPVDPRVAEKMAGFLTLDGLFGNPASQHDYGQSAAAAVEEAREQIATVICAQPREIVFTSGATEANNLALLGAARFHQQNGRHIITVKTEHKAVLDPCRQLEREGFRVTYLTPASDGLVTGEQVLEAIQRDTILLSVMHVNNEIGVIQDIASIAVLAKEHGVIFHVDAAQSAGKLPLDMTQMPVDLVSFSAHKMYGPKGIGVLYTRRKPRVRLQPLIFGGGHEQGLRSGTLATHQIVGMAEALRLAQQEMAADNARILVLRNRLWDGIKDLGDLVLNGDTEHRVVHNVNISVIGVEGESLLLALRRLAISTASACNAASIEPSHVLRALGVSNELAHSSIRLSLGRYTTTHEVDIAIAEITTQVQRLRALAP